MVYIIQTLIDEEKQIWMDVKRIKDDSGFNLSFPDAPARWAMAKYRREHDEPIITRLIHVMEG